MDIRTKNLSQFVIFLVLALMLSVAANCQSSAAPVREGNILEQVSQWERSGWKPDGIIVTDAGVHHGSGSSYKLSDNKENDLRFTKSIQVYAGRFYRFSAAVRTEGVTGNIGANLSVYGTHNHSQTTLKGDTDWTRVEQVFRALKDEEVEFALRLGFWNATATGTAWFDDVRLEELADWNGAYEPIVKAMPDQTPSSAPLRLFNFLFFLPFLGTYLVVHRRRELEPSLPLAAQRRPIGTLWWLLFCGLFARLAFAAYAGFTPQLAEFKVLSLTLADPSNLSDLHRIPRSELASPLWLYWLSLVGTAVKTNMLEASAVFTMLLKLPGIMAEMVLIYLLLVRLSRQGSVSGFWWQSYFIILNPALIMVTAFWGQPVAVSAAFALCAIFLAYHTKPSQAAVCLAAAIACNLMSLVIAPIIGVMLFRNNSSRHLARFVFTAAAMIAVFHFPLTGISGGVSIDGGILLVLDHLTSILSPADSSAQQAIGIYSMCLVAVMLLDRWRPIAWVDGNGMEAYFALSYLAALLAAVLLPWSKDLSLYFALVCLVPLLSHGRNYRWAFLFLSVLLLLKPVYLFSYYVLSRKGVPTDTILPYVAVGTVLVLIVLEFSQRFQRLKVISNYSAVIKRRFMDNWLDHDRVPDRVFVLLIRDYCAVFVIWALAFSLLLFNIGDWRYPTKGHLFSAESESFELEFESPLMLSQVRVYTGAKGTGAVRFECWSDNAWEPLWSENGGTLRYLGSRDFYSAFKALSQDLRQTQSVERLRVTIFGADFDINELALIGVDGKPILPAKILQPEGGQVFSLPYDHPLFNEQDQITSETGYRARSIWDEVSLARSAYELINGTEPFERAHPPLGKTLIGFGVRLFDMTPFGWRFMDALSVSVLPVLLFVGGRWVTGKRLGAYLASVLAVFELMFFIHGRWANIDTFMVLFLTACILALYRWHMLGGGRFLRQSLGWFFSAGLLFGLAASVKWNALFVGFALLVLLLCSKISGFSAAMRERLSDSDEAIGRFCRRDLIPNVVYWSLAFLLLPATIYYFSHYEFVRAMPESPGIWSADGMRTFIEQQVYAWTYHADREASHSGSSLFFTWPVLWKPMWMYTPAGVPAGMHASMSLIGNPAIWWSGFIIMLGIGWTALAGKNYAAIFLAGIFFLQCLPWLLITRTSFIYHYYPFLPLLILGIAYAASCLNYGKWLPRITLATYLALVISAFALYYPLVTATPVPEGYVESLRVFDTWSVL